MAPLSTIPLPLPANKPPPGYGWEERDISVLSTTTAFNTGIERRDTFLGQLRCIICGHLSPPEANLKYIRKFVLVNYSNKLSLQQFHGKAIALDIKDRYTPFPSLFILHEMRVRGFHPFEPIEPDMPDDGPWQDWITSDGVFDNVSDSFKRDSPPDNGDNNNNNSFSTQSQPQHQPTTSTGGASSGKRKVTMNADVIAEILAATRAMPSWKACQMEGTSWTGTAQENIEKYVSSIGIDHDVDPGGSRQPNPNLQDESIGWMS
ncbi:hypothetical protein AN958_02905 [Leucoagaricus sp. SymC.cos]|nr:hypothetical protein AN958_02905 [Leucoagaricus sp. SymC.cos]